MTRARRTVGRHADLLTGLASAVTASLIAVVALRAWRLDLGIPIKLGGDANQVLSYVQNLIETGSPSLAPRLGAPFGQQAYDFPLGADNLNFALLRLIAALTNDAVVTVNVFYLLTFPLVALMAFWAMRGLGIARPVAFVGAVIYAVVPFHFLRSTGHLFLSAYFAVPLACLLLVSTLNGRALFGLRRRNGESRTRRWLRFVASVALGVVVATTGIYYAAFTLILLVPATILGWLRARSASVVASSLLAGGVIVSVLIVNMLPTLAFWAQNGSNPDVPTRSIGETGLHQLRLATLLMPVLGHRFGPFASLARAYANAFPPTGENGESMGLVGGAGLVLLFVIAVGVLVGVLVRRRIWRSEGRLAALTLVAFLVATSGGMSGLFALIVTPQIRAWARMSIFIDFFALLAVGLALTLAWRVARKGRWRIPAAIGLAVLIPFAALDQTSNVMVPAYVANRTAFAATDAFVKSVEEQLPPGSAVYQLPYRAYPEGGPLVNSVDYDAMQLYLHSRDLRLSYGGVKGREAGWQLFLNRHSIGQVLPLVCLAGFAAVVVDRAAYRAGAAGATENELTLPTQAQPIVGDGDRYAVFDVQPFCDSVRAQHESTAVARLQDELMRPVWVRWTAGARPIVAREANEGTRRVRPPGQLSLVNDGDAGRLQAISFRVDSTDPVGSQVDVQWPDGSTQTVSVGEIVTKTLEVPSGLSSIKFVSHEQGVPLNEFVVSDLWAIDLELATLAGAGP